MLPRSGAARCVFGAFDREVVEGDVLVLNGNGAKLCARDGSELAFGCIYMRVEHLFASFRVSEICRLQNVIAEFKDPRLYSASAPLAVECHRLFGEVSARAPDRLDQDRHSQLLWSAAALLSAEFNNSLNERAVGGFIQMEDSLLHEFEKLTPDDLLNLLVLRRGEVTFALLIQRQDAHIGAGTEQRIGEDCGDVGRVGEFDE